MNAIDFVKKYGINVANNLMCKTKDVACYVNVDLSCCIYQGSDNSQPSINLVYVFHRNDLKQIVDAFDLVVGYGGLAEAKWVLDDPEIDASEAFDLKQAVNLVELCQ